MSTAGMAGSVLLPGHTHIRIHLQRAGSGAGDQRGESLCGAPPVPAERIEMALRGMKLWPSGRYVPLPNGPRPVQLVTCRYCVRLIDIHVLSPWTEGDVAPGVGLACCGAYAIRDPALAIPAMIARLPAGAASVLVPCPRDRLIDANDLQEWVKTDHSELWRLCLVCKSQMARHERVQAARRAREAASGGLVTMGAAKAAPRRPTGAQRRLARAVEANPRAAIDPAMVELARRDAIG